MDCCTSAAVVNIDQQLALIALMTVKLCILITVYQCIGNSITS